MTKTKKNLVQAEKEQADPYQNESEPSTICVDPQALEQLETLARILGSPARAVTTALRVLCFQLKDSDDPKGDALRLERHNVAGHLRKRSVNMKRGLDLQPMKRS